MNSQVLGDLDNHFSFMPPPHKDDIKSLLQEFPEVTADLPGYCNILLHDIVLNSECGSPFRQSAKNRFDEERGRLFIGT